MKLYSIVAAAVLFAFAGAAQGATWHKHRHYHHRHSATAVYNGQDYLGKDPDPNVRSYIKRDLDSHYK